MTPTVEHNAALPYPVLIETPSSKSRSKPPLVTTTSVDNPPFANGYSNSTANNNMEVRVAKLVLNIFYLSAMVSKFICVFVSFTTKTGVAIQPINSI